MGRGRAGGSERLDDRDHAGAQALLLAGRHGHQLADGSPMPP